MTTRTASRPMGASMTDIELDMPIIDMAVPMPGFPAHQQFVLVRLNDQGLLYAFTSIQDPELRFLVAPPEPFFPDYAPEIENDVLAALNTKDPDRLLVMVVITAGTNETTANLLAPIIVDRDSKRAMQVVLSDSKMPVRAIMRRDF
ncbi:MAG: flagellar assembly protein FliW [Propionibacteriaceae bacterium]